jgi:glycosyltransferase involved in cell wall biosynthesis
MTTLVTSSFSQRSRPPRIVIDVEKIRRINCGLGRFSLHLARGIIENCRGRIDPVLVLPAGGDRHFGSGFQTIRVRPWKKESLRRWVRPVARPFLGRPRHDLWHMTNQMSRYEPLDPRVPLILTIHDLTFLHEAPQDGRMAKIDRMRADIQRRIDRSFAITVDSEFVAADVRRELDVGGRPIHVIPLGLVPPAQASGNRPWFLTDDRPFLLSVGNALAHKNFHVLLDLLEVLPDRRLVIAGNATTDYGDHLRRLVSRKRLGDRVLMPGEVSDADRQWLYERCEAFLFPSLSEGFGFPVLEAMAAGRPVFVARLTSLPEITGEHGFYFDSFTPEAMAAAIRTGLARFEADAAFAERARSHAEAFTWAETTRRYADLYEQLVAG